MPSSCGRVKSAMAWVLWTVAALARDTEALQMGNSGNVISGAGDVSRVLEGDTEVERGEERIVFTDGLVFQTMGCPQLITEAEAMDNINSASTPGNIVRLLSEGPGRSGNHFLVISAYFAMGYCCRSKVLELPEHDDQIPSQSEGTPFQTDKRFFDFSGVDTLPLEEYAAISEDPAICPQEFIGNGVNALFLTGIHPELMSCMNRVYLRGCEATYLEPLLGDWDFCDKPAADEGRHLREDGQGQDEELRPKQSPTHPDTAVKVSSRGRGDQVEHIKNDVDARRGKLEVEGKVSSDFTQRPSRTAQNVGAPGTRAVGGKSGSAGSLVIHIRSGDIFLPENAEKMKKAFPGYGQPPLQFYLWAIASQPWSDVSVVTFAPSPVEVNPAFAALEMMGRTGMLGPNFVAHKNRDLLTDIQAMLCADGLAISRSTLHFLTTAHSRAKHFFIPSECGHGNYRRSTRDHNALPEKPNPNNTTLLCIEKPEAEVYGVVWEESEEAYGIYNGWQDTDRQLLDMVLFQGIEALPRCCV